MRARVAGCGWELFRGCWMWTPSLGGGLQWLKPLGLYALEGWKGPGLFEEMLEHGVLGVCRGREPGQRQARVLVSGVEGTTRRAPW